MSCRSNLSETKKKKTLNDIPYREGKTSAAWFEGIVEETRSPLQLGLCCTSSMWGDIGRKLRGQWNPRRRMAAPRLLELSHRILIRGKLWPKIYSWACSCLGAAIRRQALECWQGSDTAHSLMCHTRYFADWKTCKTSDDLPGYDLIHNGWMTSTRPKIVVGEIYCWSPSAI